MGSAMHLFAECLRRPHAKREDAALFNNRFARSRSLLHFIACGVLGGPEGADLAVWNCWRRASHNPPTFSHDGAFRSWLLRVLIDEALTIRRSGQRQQLGDVTPSTGPGINPQSQTNDVVIT